MLRSLRFQLPALFLLGVVVAGLVSAAIALRLFRTYAQNRARAQAYGELSQEAKGLTRLYASQAGLKLLSASKLELVAGFNLSGTIKAVLAGVSIMVVGSLIAGIPMPFDPMRLDGLCTRERGSEQAGKDDKRRQPRTA